MFTKVGVSGPDEGSVAHFTRVWKVVMVALIKFVKRRQSPSRRLMFAGRPNGIADSIEFPATSVNKSRVAARSEWASPTRWWTTMIIALRPINLVIMLTRILDSFYSVTGLNRRMLTILTFQKMKVDWWFREVHIDKE